MNDLQLPCHYTVSSGNYELKFEAFILKMFMNTVQMPKHTKTLSFNGERNIFSQVRKKQSLKIIYS